VKTRPHAGAAFEPPNRRGITWPLNTFCGKRCLDIGHRCLASAGRPRVGLDFFLLLASLSPILSWTFVQRRRGSDMRPPEPDAAPLIAPRLIQIRRNGLNSTFLHPVRWAECCASAQNAPCQFPHRQAQWGGGGLCKIYCWYGTCFRRSSCSARALAYANMISGSREGAALWGITNLQKLSGRILKPTG